MDLYTFNSVIDSISICQEKTVTGVVSDDSGIARSKCCCQRHKEQLKQILMENIYKAKTGDVLVFSFVGMAESTTKVGSSSTNIKMQSGVNLNEVLVMEKLQVKLLQELLNKLKLRFWSVKRYKYFSSTSR
jgi:hypothetical protein